MFKLQRVGMNTISVLSLKGGVGKTTVTVNLGAALSLKGYRVLMVDMDPQNDLTQFLGEDPKQIKGVEYLLTADMTFPMILKRYRDQFDILPAGKKLKELEISLSKNYPREKKFAYLLKDAFRSCPSAYDYVLFDSPPYAGLLNYNILAYSENLLIPVQSQYLGLNGARRTMFLYHKIRSLYNTTLRITAVLPVMYDARNKLSGVALEKMKNGFTKYLSDTVIRQNVSLAEAPAYHKTIFDYKPNSRGAQDFKKLAEEIASKLPVKRI